MARQQLLRKTSKLLKEKKLKFQKQKQSSADFEKQQKDPRKVMRKTQSGLINLMRASPKRATDINIEMPSIG